MKIIFEGPKDHNTPLLQNEILLQYKVQGYNYDSQNSNGLNLDQSSSVGLSSQEYTLKPSKNDSPVQKSMEMHLRTLESLAVDSTPVLIGRGSKPSKNHSLGQKSREMHIRTIESLAADSTPDLVGLGSLFQSVE